MMVINGRDDDIDGDEVMFEVLCQIYIFKMKVDIFQRYFIFKLIWNN